MINYYNISCNILFTILIVDEAKMDEYQRNLSGATWKRISGIKISQNQNVYYSLLIHIKPTMYLNNMFTIIYKTDLTFQASDWNPYSFAHEGKDFIILNV